MSISHCGQPRQGSGSRRRSLDQSPTEPVGSRTLKQALEGPKREIILEVLDANNWNRHATAEALGINRTTLYKKMKRLGLEEPRHLAVR